MGGGSSKANSSTANTTPANQGTTTNRVEPSKVVLVQEKEAPAGASPGPGAADKAPLVIAVSTRGNEQQPEPTNPISPRTVKKATEQLGSVQSGLSNKSSTMGAPQAMDDAPEGMQEGTKFDTFTMNDGTEYTTYVQEDGKRFYIDWETQRWLRFPDDWLQYGQFESDRQNNEAMRGGNISGNTAAGDLNAGNNISETERYRIFTDSRGRVVTTYLFEVKTNVRHFFDDESGTWERMPLEWEAEIPEVRLLINQVKKLVPDMTEHKEIVQQLRDSNYQLSGLLKHIDVTDSIKKSIESEGEGRGSAEVIMQERLIGGTIEHAVNSEAAEKTKKLIERYEKDLADKEEKLGDLRDLNKNMERELERLKKMVEEGARDRHKITAEFETLRVAHNAEREKSTSLIKELNDYRRSGGDKFNEVVTQKDEQLLKLRYAVSTLQARLTKEAEKQTKVMTIIGNLGKLHEQLKRFKMETARLRVETAKQFRDIPPIIRRVLRPMMERLVMSNNELQMMRSKYRSETLQRKLLYNKLQELRGNIRVFCRIRWDERLKQGGKILNVGDNTDVTLNDGKISKTYSFDRAFDVEASQEDVYSEAEPIITSCLDGYNVCIMAYGQTGSGKTFTMTGTNEKPGVNVRALKDLFRIMRERSEYEYSIKVSMLEIYNERIFDLLTDDILEDGAEGEDGATGAGGGGKSKKFEIRHTPSGQVHIPGLTEIPATSLQHVIKLLAKGSANRTVAATKMNLTSSRSHSVLQVIVTGHNRLSKETMNGKLTLVDLAGSERVSRSEATGARLVEAAAINKSLSTLGQVFTSLRNKALHVPYRNSKLTYLLQDSLGGDSKTALFMNVSPLNLDAVETSATLMFGLGVRAVELGPAKKHVEKTTKK